MVLRKTNRGFLTAAILAGSWAMAAPVAGQDSEPNRSAPTENKQLVEPVYRVAKSTVQEDGSPRLASISGPHLPATEPTVSPTAVVPHPLDAALEMAHSGLDHIQESVFDYTATMVKRERLNGKLGDHEFMSVKIRNEREVGGKPVPFSIYMKFLKPKSVEGREVIWVRGQNEGKILAHETGMIAGFKTFHLDPTGWLAMQNNRHPIYEAGMENLVLKLIEKAERDRAAGQCKVEYRKGAKINGRACTMISVTHDEQKHPYEFHNAQVFIDDELNVPIRYASYDWPAAPGEKPLLIEEYTYVNVKLNVGLTDKDFDPANSEYNFPGY